MSDINISLPSANSYARFNTDGTITLRIPSEVIEDIGAATSNNPSFTGIIKESENTLTGINNSLINSNNSIMKWNLVDNSTLVDELEDGQSCLIIITYNGNSLEMPDICWYDNLGLPINEEVVKFFFEKIGTILNGYWISI